MEHSLLLYISIDISLFIGICYLYQTLYLFLPYILPKQKYRYTAKMSMGSLPGKRNVYS